MIYDETADFAEKRKFVLDLVEMAQIAGIDGMADWLCLELGGEGGVLAGLMGRMVGRIVSTDIVPAEPSYDGGFLPALMAKFARHGENFPLDRVEFLTADAQKLPFRNDWFDLCFSQNAFEHISDPERALREAFRVTKPGGYIYVMFDPIWTADSGSHFLEYIGAPWKHLIAEDDEIAEIMRSNGANEGEIRSYRNHMNRLPITYYIETFSSIIGELGGTVIFHHQWSGCLEPSYVDHPNRSEAAEKLNLNADDLLIRGLRYFIQV